MAQSRTTCSIISLQSGEPLIGTATPTTQYLLVEYNAAWGAKAFEESRIPEPVKAHISSYAKSKPDIKVLLIHRPGSARSKIQHFFLASVNGPDRRVYGFLYEEYEELLSLDFSAILNNPQLYQPQLVKNQLFLVCTNGRRDPCCARQGIQVYKSLSNALKEGFKKPPVPEIWQCSHIGGHRFAANLITLPYGLLYGRVDSAGALQILQAAETGSIHLPLLRGRMAYPAPAQAAEAYLLKLTGQSALSAFSLAGLENLSQGNWVAAFENRSDGTLYRLSIRAVRIDQQVYESCRLDKTADTVEYVVSII